MTVQITSVVRASDTSFNVRWTQRHFVNGAAARMERWTAVVSIVYQTPHTEERLRKNLLGIYVDLAPYIILVLNVSLLGDLRHETK